MLYVKPLLHVTLLAIACAVISGCRPKYPETIPVSGTVTLDGKPVAAAAVVFTPDEGEKATGTTDDTGRFELSTFQLGDGALPGKHRVTVSKTTVDSGDGEKIVFLVPKEYGNLQTSKLVIDVQKEMGPIQLDLQSKPQSESEPDSPPAEVSGSLENEQPSPY